MTWLDGLTFETVIVHTTDGSSVRGLKEAVYDDGLLLRDAAYLEGEDLPEATMASYFVAREVVRGMQIIKGTV